MATKGVVFVTGAAGYVGSHSVLELMKNGYDVVAVDNCSNAVILDETNGLAKNGATLSGHHTLPESLRRVEQIVGKKLKAFYKVDISDEKTIDGIFGANKFDAVIHFAALKAVGESCQIPLAYYRNNVGGTVTLLDIMKRNGVKKFIFSSSATVYGSADYLPIDESHPTGRNCTNPYGKTKYFIEEILKDLCVSEKGWSVASLRYFNPVGAHESGEIGEDPHGVPNNLMPYLCQVAVRRRPYLNVFGNDFKTSDGTGVRDYIHIMDLAKGHVMTLDTMLAENWNGWNVLNLGAGRGYSVLDVISAFEESTGVNIPYKIVDRRLGDIDELWADVQKANDKLNWKAELSLKDMCAHSWKWQSKNPMGYQTSEVVAVKNGVSNGNHSNGNGVNGSNGNNLKAINGNKN
ncbi:unnamed protein product [Oppiella nova]|uniref:UDP-N-acetylglucosamine 4-epimerase n=2 Tax=Oppiella nova TaxID=334625 RepID=A0A7R9QFH1_9ACAR|nr:unnamed protein product [Oppiella nova]CAD7657546.1 unnamed protein product [Oppiella nova]CAG2164794.1 unnamed protein product [Oppiella nova]CAG2174732.1 unnamed protein product [Oppiella nova]